MKKVVGIVGALSIMVPAVAFGQSYRKGYMWPMVRPAAIGKVSGVSGSTITITGKNGASYTIDASNAIITKLPKVTIQISDIQSGDTVAVFGTVSGSTITATKITDGANIHGGMPDKNGHGQIGKVSHNKTGVMGTVIVDSGSSITLNGKNGTTYTIDASNAKIVRRFGGTIQVADIQVGDRLAVMGTLSGTTMTATMVRDNSLQAPNTLQSGTITGIVGTSFTLQTKNHGLQTVTTDGSTVFKKSNQAAAITDLAIGQTVRVIGEWDSTANTIAAHNVTMVVYLLGIRITGTIQSITSSAIGILGSDGTVYSVDASHAYIAYQNGYHGDLSVLQVNDAVKISGRHQSGSTSVMASLIRDTSQVYP